MIRALARPAVRITQRRCASTSATTPAVQLQNIESRWATLSAQEQSSVAKHLEQIQAGEWTKMTTEQKKAAYWVAFGPHGARTPLTGPGHALKVAAGTTAVVGAAGALFLWIRSKGGEKPTTMTKEWQEASNEYARANKINPISGVSSEDYKGTGFVSSSKN
ncbi:cytochrome c oxidase subunit IV [Linnemannia elongata]|uniref:Cytochrome c oxidase subunit IV n=1 Tax=Linnemannia elongata AG-77 TaxID=1314771 RepID=A0A197KC50_9FUNG|nr:Cytochrome c oxidase subunit 5A [Linnemannia elongata]KAG0077653.1 Cytochrome c oxidase subunit 5A [Linnemannia elongata]KAH7046251.1 cytochrome c oxidase subunit IV [Linnemannia elongata]KAK5801903.1 cytochrome c oxidase subunit IV [Linnemannia elongata]OAQ33979.1 cytochrome c oxidase subunit IV [Linnemannia elongata AG-77]